MTVTTADAVAGPSIVTEEESIKAEGNDRKEPDFCLEWKDMKIEIKVYGKDIDSEDEEFLEFYPKLSEDLLSSECIEQRKEERKDRPSSRIAHTLTALLEQDQEVNRRLGYDDDEEEEETSKPTRGKEGKNSGGKKGGSAEKEEDEEVEEATNVKNLITLPNGQKKCHVCGKIFTDQSRIKRHLLSHSGKKPFSCHLCGWGFYQKCNMDRHMASHTKEGEGEPCPHCNNWFTTKSVLSLHMRDAHNDRLLTKKEVEITMNRMRRQREEQRKQAEREEQMRKIQERAALQQRQRQLHIQRMKQRQFFQQQQAAQQLTAANQGASFFEPFTFQQQQSLFASQEEMVRQMSRLANLTCNLCGKTFVKKTNLKHHMMLHRGEKPWKCDVCDWRFVQKCNLKKHMESHTNGAFACPVCDVKFSSKSSCSTHLFRAHRDQFPEGSIKDAPNQDVFATTSQDKPVTSNWWKQLDMKGASSSNLQAALSSIPKKKPDVSQPLTCNKCGKMFLTKEHLSKHMLVHNAGIKPYACPVCGCRFHLLHNMKRHIFTHEEQGDIEKGTAEGLIQAAGSTSSQAAAVTRPIQAGLLGKLGPISQAGVTVDSKGNMKCNICRKWFPSAVELGAHMELHDKSKPFVCSICGWRFKQHQNLKRHMHTHTGIKPFTCDFCERSYTDAYTLKMHIGKAHPEVASSLPSMQIAPKPQVLQGGDEGFNNMLEEMQRKEDAAQVFQSHFMQTGSGNTDDNGEEEEEFEDLPLEPDINMFTPEEEMVVEGEDEEDEELVILDNSNAQTDKAQSKPDGNKAEESKTEENNTTVDDNQDIQDILDMDDEDEEIVEEIQEDNGDVEDEFVEEEEELPSGADLCDELDIVDNLEDDLKKLEEQVDSEIEKASNKKKEQQGN